MKNQLYATIVVFGNLSSSGSSGLAFFNHQLSKYFYNKESLVNIYCLDFDNTVEIPHKYINSLNAVLILKYLFKSLRFIKRHFSGFQERLVKEYIFDLYFSLILDVSQSNLILNLKPINPNINKIAQKKKVKVVTLATVAHPAFIRSMIKKLEEQFDIKDNSSYSNETRIKRVAATYRSSDAVVPKCNSKFIADTFLKNGIRPENLILLPSNSSLDFDAYTPTFSNNTFLSDELCFLTVGFMSLKKGLPLLLQAWSELLEEHSIKGKLIIAGKVDRSTKESIRNIRSLQNVEFLGHTTNIDKTYRRANIFIASSVSDLLPKTVLEAMACGLPVIVSKNCGNADLVQEGINGFLYDPFDTEKLKELIMWFLLNPDKISDMGKNARESSILNTESNFFEDMYLACKQTAGIKQIYEKEF